MPSDQFGRDGAGPTEVGRDLKVDQRLDPVGPRRDVAAADGGGQGLGKAADPDHAGQTVEGREARRGFGFEIGEDVVLDDGEVVGRRPRSGAGAPSAAEIVAPVGLWSAELVM